MFMLLALLLATTGFGADLEYYRPIGDSGWEAAAPPGFQYYEDKKTKYWIRTKGSVQVTIKGKPTVFLFQEMIRPYHDKALPFSKVGQRCPLIAGENFGENFMVAKVATGTTAGRKSWEITCKEIGFGDLIHHCAVRTGMAEEVALLRYIPGRRTLEGRRYSDLPSLPDFRRMCASLRPGDSRAKKSDLH